MWNRLLEYLQYSPETPLLFTGLYFWGFFAVLLFFYTLVYKRNTWKHAYLLVFSLFFYYKSGGFYFFLLLFSTVSDYFLGLAIQSSSVKWKRKALVVISVVVNLGMLSYYKYAYLFVDWFNQMAGTELEVVDYFALWSNQVFGSGFDIESIFLPVGISFFTFQTISYTVDVYKGKVEPVRNIVNFGFYVSFFPQLVAGPIVRAAEFIPQLYKPYKLTKEIAGHAMFLIMNGLVKKVVVSDYISINFVDRVFDSPLSFTGIENLFAVYGYSLQIYCDFSGYTDIAIGVALLLGFRLPINFNSPYKANNITDFWRRWHISLSRWLKDYLYIPLGGNRKGKTRTYLHLMITMLLGGLWHGASLRFVIWGALHGLGLALHKLWLNLMGISGKNLREQRPWYRLLRIIVTFHFVCFAWIFFRANSFEKARQIIEQIWSFSGVDLLREQFLHYRLILFLMLVTYILHWLPSKYKEWYRGLFIRLHPAGKIAVMIVLVFLMYQFQTAGLQPFIYFQF